MNKSSIYFFVFFVLAAAVLAAPKPVFEQSNVGLTITTAHPSIMKFNASNEIYFHVYNSTNFWLNNSQATCNIHVYNKTNGVHLYENLIQKHLTTEFEWVLNYSLIKSAGNYPIIIYCNSSQGEFGFLREELVLTTYGEPVNFEAFILGAIFILIPLIFGWMLLHWCISLGDDHAIMKIWMSIMALMTVLLSLWFAIMALIKFMEWGAMQDGLSTAVWVFGMMFFMIITYFIIYLIVKAIHTAAKQRVQRLNY